ncbi:heterokaryon incompatibility protein-domain-containing protein [Hyaloscypha finlandica]|nr:heterokaryon incompatibility protein-domain-containing protein [Hyaloscypha finlandica]
MRLLNVYTMKLEEYFGSQIPEYAILSHCWGMEEVTFQHISSSEWHGMCGATKIKYASSRCKEEGLRYIWIDTCCIDKSSSAELSEAINSMYGWYEGSIVCYAYLEDVGRSLSTQTSYGPSNKDKTFEASRWFTRGWTLQELIAPTKVNFFDKQWQYLGSKRDLSPLLSRITSIPEDVLTEPKNQRNCSVARKMTWAAKRQTTRIEDVAYSLFGIFDINMPLLHGEGRGAFIRLQEEILKETDDQSILAWDNGVFASSPDNFLGSEDVVPFPSKPGRQPLSMTNKGVRIEVPVLAHSTDRSSFKYPFAILDCQINDDFSGAIGIPLTPTHDDSTFIRNTIEKIITWPASGFAGLEARTIYIAKNPRIVRACAIARRTRDLHH